MHGLILSELARLSISTECIVYILSERGTDGGKLKGVTRDGMMMGWWSDSWQEEATPTSDNQVSRGWALPEDHLEAVMRIQAVVTPSSPEPPTSFSDQVRVRPTLHILILILTHRWKVESLSPDVEISVFTMYSGNGFFSHLLVCEFNLLLLWTN